MASKTSEKAKNNDKSYRQLSDALDAVMLKLSASELDVDEAVNLYESGLKLVKQLETNLTSAENKVAKLKASTLAKG